MIAIGSCRLFSMASSFACNSSIASKARFNGESSVVFMVDWRALSVSEFTFAPAVLKAEPRLHHRTTLQFPAHAETAILGGVPSTVGERTAEEPSWNVQSRRKAEIEAIVG